MTLDGPSPQAPTSVCSFTPSTLPPTTAPPREPPNALDKPPVAPPPLPWPVQLASGPMSSTLGPESADCVLQQAARLPAPPPDDGVDQPLSHHNGAWKEERSWHRLFRNGLPTPPTAKAMTGLTLNNHYYTNGVHPPAPSVTTQPPRDAAAGENSTADRTRAGGNGQGQDQHPRAYHDRSDRHRPSSSRDFGFDPKKGAGNVIASNFRIPESVNSSGGSIAEFAAEITCLFWFESAATVQHAEDLPDLSFVDRGLVPDATPSIGFRKWVTTILTTTLVSKNVILLALLFVYRLKKFNPGVSGKRGSEFRLFTIALMLGNKFLDDNTYTNKTWAEVSGISVTEIHIMEVEFLSNMRYNLYVSEAEWGRWKVKLGRFGAFVDAASKMACTDPGPVTPLAQSFPHKLPSPPSTHHSMNAYAPRASAPDSYASLPGPYSTTPQTTRPSPVREIPPERPARKRSLDATGEGPPAKRAFYPDLSAGRSSVRPTPDTGVPTPGTLAAYPPGAHAVASHAPSAEAFVSEYKPVPRLPMPRIHTTASQLGDPISNHLAPLSLPTQRAMSTVYPSSSTAWSQHTTPGNTTMGPFPSTTTLYANPIPTLATLSRSESAFPSATASPSTAYSTATPTRPGLSPSYFLTNRSSPYRPVRHVNTLLIPPPPASLNNPTRHIGHDQMQYQPLSKNSTAPRAGVVPYLHPEAWSQLHSQTPPMPVPYDIRT